MRTLFRIFFFFNIIVLSSAESFAAQNSFKSPAPPPLLYSLHHDFLNKQNAATPAASSSALPMNLTRHPRVTFVDAVTTIPPWPSPAASITQTQDSTIMPISHRGVRAPFRFSPQEIEAYSWGSTNPSVHEAPALEALAPSKAFTPPYPRWIEPMFDAKKYPADATPLMMTLGFFEELGDVSLPFLSRIRGHIAYLTGFEIVDYAVLLEYARQHMSQIRDFQSNPVNKMYLNLSKVLSGDVATEIPTPRGFEDDLSVELQMLFVRLMTLNILESDFFKHTTSTPSLSTTTPSEPQRSDEHGLLEFATSLAQKILASRPMKIPPVSLPNGNVVAHPSTTLFKNMLFLIFQRLDNLITIATSPDLIPDERIYVNKRIRAIMDGLSRLFVTCSDGLIRGITHVLEEDYAMEHNYDLGSVIQMASKVFLSEIICTTLCAPQESLRYAIAEATQRLPSEITHASVESDETEIFLMYRSLLAQAMGLPYTPRTMSYINAGAVWRDLDSAINLLFEQLTVSNFLNFLCGVEPDPDHGRPGKMRLPHPAFQEAIERLYPELSDIWMNHDAQHFVSPLDQWSQMTRSIIETKLLQLRYFVREPFYPIPTHFKDIQLFPPQSFTTPLPSPMSADSLEENDNRVTLPVIPLPNEDATPLLAEFPHPMDTTPQSTHTIPPIMDPASRSNITHYLARTGRDLEFVMGEIRRQQVTPGVTNVDNIMYLNTIRRDLEVIGTSSNSILPAAPHNNGASSSNSGTGYIPPIPPENEVIRRYGYLYPQATNHPHRPPTPGSGPMIIPVEEINNDAVSRINSTSPTLRTTPVDPLRAIREQAPTASPGMTERAFDWMLMGTPWGTDRDVELGLPPRANNSTNTGNGNATPRAPTSNNPNPPDSTGNRGHI